MKLMVLGHARHGKDSVCDLLHKHYGLTFQSSSYFVAERAVKPYLAKRGIVYPDFDTMYADRVNRRQDWFEAIADYNDRDLARLGRELYEKFDIYCGIRSVAEFRALQAEGLIDFTIWVDASLRCPPEPNTSITVHEGLADYTIDNNSTYQALENEVHCAYNEAIRRLYFDGPQSRAYKNV